MSVEDELMEDALAKEQQLPSDNMLKTLSGLADEVKRRDEELAELKEEIKRVQYERDLLTQQNIPDLMHELGMEKFTLHDGTGVELKPEVYASIPEAKREAALKWLREHGYGDLIKRTLTLQFGMGEDEKAQQLANTFLNDGYNYSQKVTVLPQTLKAFVREQDAQGRIVPDDLFNIHRVTVAKLKQPK